MSQKPSHEELEQRIQMLEKALNGREASNQQLRATRDMLRESEDRYHAIAEDTPALICRFLPDGEIVNVNDAYCDYFNKTAEELVGVNFLTLIPESDRAAVMNNILSLTAAHPTQSHEHQVISPEGHTRWQKWTNKGLFDKHGDVRAYQSVGEDITDRKNAEEALKAANQQLSASNQQLKATEQQLRASNQQLKAKEQQLRASNQQLEASNQQLRATGDMLRKSEERFRAIYENAPVLIDAFDSNGRCVLWNKECRKTFGWTIEEINAHGDALSLFYPDPAIREEVTRTVTNDPDMQFREWHPITKDGKTLDTMWANIRLPDGLTFNLGYDITEQKKLEKQLHQSQKLESIGNLAGGIAHDFNNILSSIIGFTELAIDETPKGTVVEDSLQEVYAAGKRAKDLVRQILAFARQSDEKIGPIPPSTTVKEVLHFIRSTIPTTIEIQQEIESESLIMGNATQVHQVLMNLCTNAAHAMEDSGGILSVSLKDVFLDKELEPGIRPGDYVEIKVSDTGVGIAPETIDSIFEPYFTTKGVGEGTGLGLAMVQGVVASYGGKITANSQLGKGTIFTIYLPITKKRSAQHAYVPEELPTGTERILFVDDEASIAKMGSQILENLGYTVTTRTSSIEGLELFSAKPNDFDLVVTDMTMPDMTGDKLAVELMQIRSDIPVVLCTGYSKKMSDELASDIGVKALAYKPIVKADLAKTIRKVLDKANS